MRQTLWALLMLAPLLGGCGPKPTSDLDAFNNEDTGPYRVVSERVTGTTLLMRVQPNRMGAAQEIAADLIAIKKPLNYDAIRLEFVGPNDPEHAPARQVVNWPTEPIGQGSP